MSPATGIMHEAAPETRAVASDLDVRDVEGQAERRDVAPRSSSSPSGRVSRPSRSPGMHFGHELLLAVTMAVALLATLIFHTR
jgi:hypothetical protein